MQQESLDIPIASTFKTRRTASFRKRSQFVGNVCRAVAEDGARIDWHGDTLIIHNTNERISIVFEIVNKDGRE